MLFEVDTILRTWERENFKLGIGVVVLDDIVLNRITVRYWAITIGSILGVVLPALISMTPSIVDEECMLKPSEKAVIENFVGEFTSGVCKVSLEYT